MNLSSVSQKGQETYRRLCIPVKTDVKLDSVILSDENEYKLNEFITERENQKKFAGLGLDVMNRLLLYGASGTGKTYLTRAIATYFNVPLLQMDVSKIKAEDLSQSLTDIFALAQELGKVVIFIDECDSICWSRDDKDNKDDAAVRRANNTLFQLLDQLNEEAIFVSATNLYENLDPAFVRRFNIKMKFLAPKIDNFGLAVKKFIGRAFSYEEDMMPDVRAIVDFQARNFSRMSYYQIKDWVQRAEKVAIINNTTRIKESAIYDQLMKEMRIEVKYDSESKPYLHQYGVQSK